MAKALTEQQKADRAKAKAALLQAQKARKEQEAQQAQPQQAQPTKATTPTKATQTATQPTKATEQGTEIKQEKLKHLWGISGVTLEIGPNLEDLKYNQYEQGQQLRAHLQALGFKDGTVGKSAKMAELYKANGEIMVIPTQYKGITNTHYMVILKATKDIHLSTILQGVHYPMTKGQARELGRDNREFTYQQLMTLTIKAGEAIPLGITSNRGKAINNYQGKWATLYKVGTDTKDYNILRNEGTLYTGWTGKEIWTEIGKNSGQEIRSGTLAELIGATRIYNPMVWAQIN